MANALLIKLQTAWTGDYATYGTSVFFDTNEYMDCDISSNSDCTIAESRTQLPTVYDPDKMLTNESPTYIAKIKINCFYSTTLAKVQQIVANKNWCKIYHRYIESPATVLGEYIVNPEYSETYYFGEHARHEIELTFYKSSATKAYGNSLRLAGIDYIPEIIIDPDGKNIVLNGTQDAISFSPVVNEIDVDLANKGEIINTDVYVEFHNYKHFFENFRTEMLLEDSKWYPFRIGTWLNKGTSTAGDSYFYIDTYSATVSHGMWGEIQAQAYDLITITDFTNTETFSVSSVQAVLFSGDYYQKINLSGVLANTYAEGAYVYLYSFMGKKVNIRLKRKYNEPTGTVTYDTYTIFKGIIREPFNVMNDSAVLKIDNILNEVFKKPLQITATDTHVYQRYNSTGTLADSDTWTTQTGSGTFDATALVVYTGAYIGKWIVTFSSDTVFSVTGLNCNAKAGSTAADFYDQTDATDSQIKIPTAVWGGTPANGDVLEFYVSLNYEEKSVSQIFYDALITHAGLTASDIDSTTIFSTGSGNFKLTIYEFCTIGDLLACILAQEKYYFTMKNTGAYKLTQFKKYDFNTTTDIYNTEVTSTTYQVAFTHKYSLGYSDIYNQFNIKYGWNNADETYKNTYNYPLTTALNYSNTINGKTRAAEISLPSIYLAADVLTYAQYLYKTYGWGYRIIESESTLGLINILNVGDILEIDIFGSRVGWLITKIEIDLNNMLIKYQGINLGRNF